MPDPRSILITGASSGLGAALAKVYARPGVRLALTGRNEARLGATVDACLLAGAEVTSEILDVTDTGAMARWLARVDRERSLDLVIANAGISAGTGGDGEDLEQSRAIVAVNVGGVINTVMPVVEPMRARRAGQIAIISSLASFRGFPGAPAYCASKAAVRSWGEALRGELHPDRVAVTVVCPGYIRTPMTAVNDFPMPMLMEVEAAARLIRDRLVRRPARIAFPWPLYFAAWLIGALPPAATDPLLRRFPKKI